MSKILIAGARRVRVGYRPSRLTSLPLPAIAIPPASPHFFYSTRVEPKGSKSAAIKRKQVPFIFDKAWKWETFTLESFEDVLAKHGEEFKSLTAEQYFDAATRFTRHLREGRGVADTIYSDKHGISAQTLHEIACIFLKIPGQKSPEHSFSMWVSASEMGYLPSTLSAAYGLVRSNLYGQVPGFARFEKQFKQVVTQGQNPNALTVHAMQLFKEDNFETAIRILLRALEVGEEGFEWKPYCQMQLADAYIKTVAYDDAKKILEPLADSGFIPADTRLGKMMVSSDPGEAEKHLYKSGLHGSLSSFGLLSQIAMERAAAAEEEESKEEHRMWAVEWSRISDKRNVS